MKVILTQEVSGLGEPGDIVDVKDGYARNFLLPRSLATPWTQGGQMQVDSIRRARKAREIASKEQAQSVKAQLESRVIRVKVKAGENGRLFGAITPATISEAMSESSITGVDKRKLEIPASIKTTGQYQITARLHPEVAARVKIDVVGS